MLNISKTVSDENAVTFELEGRLDTVSAPALQEAVEEIIGDASEIIFDFKKLEYLSSAGLRILLTTQQTMKENGRPGVTVLDANDGIREVFTITGFDIILNVK